MLTYSITHFRRNIFFFLLALSGLFAPNTGWTNNTHALIIGVDKYPYVGTLQGAKNDARHIYHALLKSGVPKKNLVKLEDFQASRSRVEAEWNKMLQRSKPGDHLIMTFAGHGTQIPDGNGDESKQNPTDKSDETFLLGAFDWPSPNHKRYREQLVDDQLGEWFANAIGQGRYVLFVADACNSGGGFRTTNGELGPTRYVVPKRGLERMDDPDQTDTDELRQSQRFAFFSGSQSDQVVTEVYAPRPFNQKGPEQLRGALSIAFAESLHEKLALVDRNRDKGLSIDELRQHIKNRVSGFSIKNQNPTFFPNRGSNVVLRVANQSVPPVAAPKKGQVQVKVSGKMPNFLAFLSHIKAVAQHYDLHWGVSNGMVFNKFGDLMARGVNTQDDISKVASRMQLVKIIQSLSMGHSIESSLGNTEQKVHRLGTPIQFSINGLKHRTLIQFNLAGNGEVQCFNHEQVNGSKSYRFRTSRPVGNDTLVTLAMDKPPARLLQLVGGQSQCTRDIDDLVNELPGLLKGRPYQISTVDTFVRE